MPIDSVRTRPERTRRPHVVIRNLTTVVVAAVALSLSPSLSINAAAGPPKPNQPIPAVYPAPQAISAAGSAISLAGKVTVVAGADTDPAALRVVTEVITAAGGTATRSSTPTKSGTQVWVGTADDNPGLATVVADLGQQNASGLVDGGYVIAMGKRAGLPTIALEGVNDNGAFYAGQTLRQLRVGRAIAGVAVRDWPLMSIRGSIEGFYGEPWSDQARLDHMTFYGRHKMNTYIYTPKDDPLLRMQWRELYSGEQLQTLQTLIHKAGDEHVNFTFALSPGNDICYSSEDDFQATLAKLNQLKSLGVHSFYIALDDIALTFHCDADRQKYPDEGNWHWLADAQVDYLNRLQREFVVPNGLQPLQTVPTNYNGSGPDPYKAQFGLRLDDAVLVNWTGEGVFSDTITMESVTRAKTSYDTERFYIWDNFPVNDGMRNRLFLNPLTGRDPQLYTVLDGFVSNPMIQPYASLPALANYADYTWNGPAYDPDASMKAALVELAGSNPKVQRALTTFADLNQSWPYRAGVVRAPQLNADITAYWNARAAGTQAGQAALKERAAAIAALPKSLKSMAEPGFYSDSQPWITAASHWGIALQQSMSMLDAVDRDDAAQVEKKYQAAKAAVARAAATKVGDQTALVGDGAFQSFMSRIDAIYQAYVSGGEVKVPYAATPSSSMGTWGGNDVTRMVDGDLTSLYWSNDAGNADQWVQLDLGAVQPVGSVKVYQSDDDYTPADMFYTGVVEYSTDGQTWTTATTFSNQMVIEQRFETAVQARYVRVRSTAAQPAGQWVKIREFIVTS